MKRLLTLLSFSIVVVLAMGQSLESFCTPDLLAAQKEGTDSIVRRYFADVPSRGDTIYVVMYNPGFAPRLEFSLNTFHDDLKAADSEAEMVLLSINCGKDIAMKYWKKMGYKSDYQLYDTDGSYYDFLSFNSSTPLCIYVLKVDKHSGRVIFSGGVLEQSKKFCKVLVADCDVRPYHTYPNKGQGGTFPLPDDMGEAELSYDRHELIQPDSLFAIGLVRYQPVMRGGNLYYDDDYSGVVQCFTMTDGGDMARRGR